MAFSSLRWQYCHCRLLEAVATMSSQTWHLYCEQQLLRNADPIPLSQNPPLTCPPDYWMNSAPITPELPHCVHTVDGLWTELCILTSELTPCTCTCTSFVFKQLVCSLVHALMKAAA